MSTLLGCVLACELLWFLLWTPAAGATHWAFNSTTLAEPHLRACRPVHQPFKRMKCEVLMYCTAECLLWPLLAELMFSYLWRHGSSCKELSRSWILYPGRLLLPPVCPFSYFWEKKWFECVSIYNFKLNDFSSCNNFHSGYSFLCRYFYFIVIDGISLSIYFKT